MLGWEATLWTAILITGGTLGFQVAVPPSAARMTPANPTIRSLCVLPHLPSRKFLEDYSSILLAALDDDNNESIPFDDEQKNQQRGEISAEKEDYEKLRNEARAAIKAAAQAKLKLMAKIKADAKNDKNTEAFLDELPPPTLSIPTKYTQLVDKEDATIFAASLGDEDFENDSNTFVAIKSRALISYTDAQTLEITLPPQNVGMSTFMSGAFSLAWFSAITPATFAARGAASLMFMLPFWIAGGVVAKAGVVDPLVRQKFTLGKYAWSLTKEIAGQTIQKVEKPTERLQGVSVRLLDIINEVPRYELELLMSGESDNYSFGIWAGEEKKKEAEELLELIDRQLRKFQQSR
jgi:hypothetical protein